MNTQTWQVQNFGEKIGPSVGGQNDPLGVQKSTTWKKTLKCLFLFFEWLYHQNVKKKLFSSTAPSIV